jgi:carbon monoxide dehydrogenase subunit G
MARLEIDTFIAAPAEDVWAVIEDFERQAAWMVDVRELEIVSEQRRGVGTVLRVTSELFGLPIVHDVMEVTAWEPPLRMDVAHRGQFHGYGQFILERADNGTVFTWIEDFEAPLGPLGEAAFALVVRPHLRRVFGRSMANVKRLAEARAAARSLA